MVSVTLTPKSARYGKHTTSLPAVDTATTMATTPVWKDTTIRHSPTVVLGDYVIFRLETKTSEVGYPAQTQIRKSDGVTVLATFGSANSTTFTTVSTTPVRIENEADWVNVQFWQLANANSRIATIKEDSIRDFYAEYFNLTDEIGFRRKVDSIFFISGAGEGINGVVSQSGAEEFSECEVNSLMSSFVWSGNVGTIYTWEGSYINIEV